MEPSASMLSRLSAFHLTVIFGAVALIVANVVMWWFKADPKPVGVLVLRCVLVVVVAAAVLYFVQPRSHDFDRLKREGLAGDATVLRVESLNVTINRRSQVRLQLRVDAQDGRPPYEVTHVDLVGLGQAVVPGRRLRVYVDRVRPERLVIDWAESTEPVGASPPARGRDVSARLAELDRLREGGQITEPEYQAQRQRILSDL
jgi:hypothetical protein